ncbi:MAG: proline--tRNA ligase [Endomicrobium sp.]|jgi:prolyl-tRNA synthetase|nr:proline--tRNA ligase [Endomicrobium sp.]
MFFSKLLIPTLKEIPADTDIISAKLMIRSGMVRKLASGLYEFLPLGTRVLKKIENILRQEMNIVGGQEIMLPLISPKELWEETGRWNIYGKELFRFKDRKNTEFCLTPTAEEPVTDLIRKEIKSYKQLPLMLYQFRTKFRDEIRPRFGVMRSKEFLMKDAYSFHTNEADLEKYYNIMINAYKNIFIKCGFKFRVVEATSGAIGGSFSHEFMILADNGEEEIVWCSCGYGANVEKAETLMIEQVKEKKISLEELFTPNISAVKDVAKFLKLLPSKFIKTMVYMADNVPVVVLVRGDHEVNEIKLQSILTANEIFIANEQTVVSITKAPVGFVGPLRLKNVKVIADLSVVEIPNAVTGANKKDYHIKNVNYGRDYKADIVADVRKVIRGDICPRCKKEDLKFSRGIEIGHVFKLGTKYSKSMSATYIDSKGTKNLIVMGCYGIGITRMLAAAIEQFHDDDGIIWPLCIAPFEVLIIPVNYFDAKIKETTDKICKELLFEGVDVLIDDRDERTGIKFKDADLIGIPYRIAIGEKNLSNGCVELKARNDCKGGGKLLRVEDVVSKILKLLK